MQKVLIIGAGLSGSLAALFFAKRNFEVHLYDKRQDLRKHYVDKGRSINLALGTRGLLALEKVGLKQKVLKYAMPMYGRMVHPLNEDPYFMGYSPKRNKAVYSLVRQNLNKTILDEAENYPNVSMHFEHSLSHINWTSNTAYFKHGQTEQAEAYTFDFLIGADGIHSKVREAIVGDEKHLTKFDTLSHSFKEITIPPLLSQNFSLSKEALHIWARKNFMLIGLPNPKNIFTGTLFLPTSGEDYSFKELNNNHTHAFFKAQFPDLLNIIDFIENEFRANPTSVLATMYCDKWTHSNKALLIGDAAHAIVPFFGQGMNSAFEDITVLDSLMDKYPDDWYTINKEYFNARKSNTDTIAQMALDNYIEMRESVIDKDFIEFKKFEWELQALFPEHFLACYEMVMFSDTPYSICRERGLKQAQIINKLRKLYKRHDQIAKDVAEQLIKKSLTSLKEIKSL